MFETLGMLKQGGWPMLALGVCSLAAVAIIMERLFALRHKKVIDARAVQVIEEYEGESSAAGALAACQRCPGAFAQVAATIIKMRHLDHAQAIESMHAAGRTQISRLERGLTVLEIIAGASPLIGLLGTVLGMVEVFNAITAKGLGNPQDLSDGISKALITTVAGLCIAIPALAFHSLFAKRVEELAAEMQDLATGFIVKLQGLQNSKE